MVEKGSDHSSDKSPSTPEQVVQRTYSLQSARSGGKNSKVSTPTPHLHDFGTWFTPFFTFWSNDKEDQFRERRTAETSFDPASLSVCFS